MSLDHLTEEEKAEILKIYPRILKSSNDGKNELSTRNGAPMETSAQNPEDGKKHTGSYEQWEVKTKQSDRIQYTDDEIEVFEEDG